MTFELSHKRSSTLNCRSLRLGHRGGQDIPDRKDLMDGWPQNTAEQNAHGKQTRGKENERIIREGTLRSGMGVHAVPQHDPR
jgi:hypothetical protein